MLRERILIFMALAALVGATEVYECADGKQSVVPNRVDISGCDKPPCTLKRKTTATIEQRFVPRKDVTNLVTSVHANVLGLILPFVGVDGTNACDNVYNTDGTPAGCSLKEGTEYVYKNSFPVLPIYPTISLVVYYALLDGIDTVSCFEVPAKITN